MVEILKYMCIPLEKPHNLFPIMLCYCPYIPHDTPTRNDNKKKWSRVCAKKKQMVATTHTLGSPPWSSI